MVERLFELVVIIKWAVSRTEACVCDSTALLPQLAGQFGLAHDKLVLIALKRFLSRILSTGEHLNWAKDSLKRVQFCALVREAGRAVDGFLESVLQIVEPTLETGRDYATRFDSLELLFHLAPCLPDPGPLSQKYLDLCLAGMKWRAGRTNESIRRTACLCLSKALAEHKLLHQCLLDSSKTLLASLKGCVEDDRSPQLRVCALQLLKLYFSVLKDQVSTEAIFDLYPLVLSRLDDPEDEVRVFAVDVFARIAVCKSFSFSESTVKYILARFLLHMDDANRVLRERISMLLRLLAREKGWAQVSVQARKSLDKRGTQIQHLHLFEELASIESSN